MGGLWLACGADLALDAVSLWNSQPLPALPVVSVPREGMDDGAGEAAVAKQG